MITILMAGRSRQEFEPVSVLFEKWDAEYRFAVTPDQVRQVLEEASVDLFILDDVINDIPARQMVEQVIMRNPMINCVVISGMGKKEFHETYEGLGVLTAFSRPPVQAEVDALSDQLETIAGLKIKASGT